MVYSVKAALWHLNVHLATGLCSPQPHLVLAWVQVAIVIIDIFVHKPLDQVQHQAADMQWASKAKKATCLSANVMMLQVPMPYDTWWFI